MYKYNIYFKYSKDGRSWTQSTKFVQADSDSGAIAQIKSMYPYVKDIRIMVFMELQLYFCFMFLERTKYFILLDLKLPISYTMLIIS